MRQHHDAICALTIFLRKESATKHRLHAKHVEEPPRHALPGESRRFRAVADCRSPVTHGCTGREHALAGHVLVRRVPDVAVAAVTLRLPHERQLITAWKRWCTEQR